MNKTTNKTVCPLCSTETTGITGYTSDTSGQRYHHACAYAAYRIVVGGEARSAETIRFTRYHLTLEGAKEEAAKLSGRRFIFGRGLGDGIEV